VRVFKAKAKNRGTNLRLREDLAIYPGPWPTDVEAKRNERRTANRVESDGYVVEVGLGSPFRKTVRTPAAEPVGAEDGALVILHPSLPFASIKKPLFNFECAADRGECRPCRHIVLTMTEILACGNEGGIRR
jgi:hypothetical protein